MDGLALPGFGLLDSTTEERAVFYESEITAQHSHVTMRTLPYGLLAGKRGYG